MEGGGGPGFIGTGSRDRIYGQKSPPIFEFSKCSSDENRHCYFSRDKRENIWEK
jgi:hypothetical protein